MILPGINFQTQETTLQSFKQIAEKLANSIQLKINDAIYRIVDFEFYSFSDAMPDPHTYKGELQLEKGKLFLHYSGIDITCGDGKNYCGILLRSVVKLNRNSDERIGLVKKQFIGPQVVSMELFSNLHNLESNFKNEISLIETGDDAYIDFQPAKIIITTARVGLKTKEDDPDDFYMSLKTRYIVVLPPSVDFRQKVPELGAWLKAAVADGRIARKEAEDLSKEILGWKTKIA